MDGDVGVHFFLSKPGSFCSTIAANLGLYVDYYSMKRCKIYITYSAVQFRLDIFVCALYARLLDSQPNSTKTPKS